MSIQPILSSPAFGAMSRAMDSEGFRVTDVDVRRMLAKLTPIKSREAQEKLGFRYETPGDALIYVTNPDKPVGHVRIHSPAGGDIVIVDNDHGWNNCFIRLDCWQGDTCSFISGTNAESNMVLLETVAMRNKDQWFFWGECSTSVGARIEIDGRGHGFAAGDDCMFSSAVTIRNHDMHTIWDVESGQIINQAQTNVILEQHVWLGDGAMLIGCDRVGFGSIVGARSFVKSSVPPMCVMAGSPAKPIRYGTTWARNERWISPATRKRIARLSEGMTLGPATIGRTPPSPPRLEAVPFGG